MFINLILLTSLFLPQTIVVDEVAAVVNDEIITLSDIDKALAFFPTLRERTETERQFYRRVLIDLIHSRMMRMEYGDEFLLDDDDLEQVQTPVIQKAGSLEKLQTILHGFDMTWDDFRVFIRDRALYEKVLRERLPSKLMIDFAEIETFYNQHMLPLQKKLDLEQRSLAEMAPVIEKYLRKVKSEQQLRTWLQELEASYRIEIKLRSQP
jgi:hypothetical protein